MHTGQICLMDMKKTNLMKIVNELYPFPYKDTTPTNYDQVMQKFKISNETRFNLFNSNEIRQKYDIEFCQAFLLFPCLLNIIVNETISIKIFFQIFQIFLNENKEEIKEKKIFEVSKKIIQFYLDDLCKPSFEISKDLEDKTALKLVDLVNQYFAFSFKEEVTNDPWKKYTNLLQEFKIKNLDRYNEFIESNINLEFSVKDYLPYYPCLMNIIVCEKYNIHLFLKSIYYFNSVCKEKCLFPKITNIFCNMAQLYISLERDNLSKKKKKFEENRKKLEEKKNKFEELIKEKKVLIEKIEQKYPFPYSSIKDKFPLKSHFDYLYLETLEEFKKNNNKRYVEFIYFNVGKCYFQFDAMCRLYPCMLNIILSEKNDLTVFFGCLITFMYNSFDISIEYEWTCLKLIEHYSIIG